jgi:Bacterial Ig-like domain (group 3)
LLVKATSARDQGRTRPPLKFNPGCVDTSTHPQRLDTAVTTSPGLDKGFRKWVKLAAAAAVPLVALGWSPSASAMPPGGVPVEIDVASSANPSTYDQSVTYTATLTTSDSGSLDIADNVEFRDGGGDISGCSSQPLVSTSMAGTYTATCDEPAVAMFVGSHDIEVDFGGDSTYAPGSGSLTQVVDQAATNTLITFPPAGSSIPYGNEGQNALNVTVSAPGVSDFSPSGSVNIYDGPPGSGIYLCTAFIGGGGSGQSSGNCYINNAQLNAGLHSLQAVYGGDSNFIGSTSVPQDLTIDQVTTQMQLFPVPGYAIYGAENGNFFITGAGGGNGGNPSGFFSITTDGLNLVEPGTCSAGNGGGNPCFIDSATTLPASSTPYEVTASYPGDANFTPASATVPLTVFPASSTTSLNVSPATAAFGNEHSVLMSATVTSGTSGAPTGTVTVQNGGATLCTITNLLPSAANAATGTCTLSPTALPLGGYAPTAVYRGDGNYQSSLSSAQSLTITSQSDQGYWLVGADGGIFAFGSAQFHGSLGSLELQRPVVGIAPTLDRGGYWLVGSDGGAFAFGDAGFYGSLPGEGISPAGTAGSARKLTAPIVGMVPSSDGGGYLMVGSDGGVFAFGDAHFAGSCPGIGGCKGSAVAVMPDASGNGYWVMTSTGNAYAFGDAPYYGAPGNQGSPVTSAVRTSDGGGYWVVLADGTVYGYGDAKYLGGPSGLSGINPATAIFATADGGGYWVASANGSINAYGDARYDGGLASGHLNAPIVAATGW